MKLATISLLKIAAFVTLSSATALGAKYSVSKKSVEPGGIVTIGGKKVPLSTGSFKLGDDIQKTAKGFALEFKNKVTIYSIVPSINTPVCEEQTHILGESKKIHKGVDLVTVSRDSIDDQKKFAKLGKLTNIKYLSDQKQETFGNTMGLGITGNKFLTRAVIVVDNKGIIRHYQVVPNVSELPDMERAIEIANKLAKGKV
jgi:thioredoxin-dependent peroxiredoxin